jgi:predicted metal-dependent hydrolase
VQFKLSFGFRDSARPTPQPDWLQVGSRLVCLWLVPNPRARRYVLRLRADGSARVAIPRGGSVSQARRFAESHIGWLEGQLLRQAVQPATARQWHVGDEILFRGERVRLELSADGQNGIAVFGTERVRVKDAAADVRPELERHLWRLARNELPGRLQELALKHGLLVRRVSVRNQRSRWGSCSRRGTISLNWRLVQTPAFVRDYIILHELAHLKEMNHSRQFWREVASLCPHYADAETWLKQNGRALR